MSEQTNVSLSTADILKVKESMGEIYVINENHSAVDGQQMACTSEQREAGVCYPVYDLESQQFLININGQLETMKASDQKMLLANNLQDGNFEVIQPKHIQQNSVNNEFKMENLSAEQGNSMGDDNTNDNMESVIQVMLDDDQCLTLEQKGRVLLEQDSRFFLLDNIGLQEITKQTDFIEQLRDEHLSLCRDKANDTEISPEPLDTSPEDPLCQSNPMEYSIVKIVEENDEDGPSDGDLDVDEYMDNDTRDETLKVNHSNELITNDIVNTETANIKQQEITENLSDCEDEGNPSDKECSEEENIVLPNDRTLEPVMTISMDYVVKELPPKLYIGQSHNGRKLYARLRKLIAAPQKSCHSIQKPDRLNPQTKTYLSPKTKRSIIDADIASRPAVQKCLNSTLNKTINVDFDEKKSQTSKLMDEVMSSDPDDVTYLLAALWYTDYSTAAQEEHLALIEKTVDSLMQLASVKKLIVGRNVIVTKVIKRGNGEVDVPFVVTGIISDVSAEREHDNWRFIYIPELLTENNEELIQEYQLSFGVTKSERLIGSGPCDRLLHIAIVESPSAAQTTTNYTTNVLVVYKSLTKLTQEFQNNTCSQLALRNVGRPAAMRHKVPSSHACAACGATFRVETELRIHQEIHKFEVKTIESRPTEEKITLKEVENSKIVLNEQQSNKMYVCYYCKKVFTRCSNLQRHMAIHFEPVVTTDSDDANKPMQPAKSGESEGVFTCNMCSCSYFYASTLTRHIMTCHIDPTKTNQHEDEF